jgi:GTP-binding protein
MPLPQVAIVGRPNVGKSSLLNRLAGRRVSIVDPTPGITRDRVSAVVEIEPPLDTPKGTPSILAEIVDTGGYGVYTAEDGRFDDVGSDLSVLTREIEQQIDLAMKKADLILFAVDVQEGLTSLDETVAALLRTGGHAEKVQVIANKADGEEWVSHAADAARLGFGPAIAVSATSGFGVRRLFDAVYARVKDIAATDEELRARDQKVEFTFAIVGKRNSGKSTLINALAGEERVIVSEIAGTTRDSIDVRFELAGHTMIAIDTAGLRKRKSMKEDVEYYAMRRALSAIRRADVVMLLIDATEPVSQVDKKLTQELQEQFKPTVIVVNKWDLAEERHGDPEKFFDYLERELRGLDFAPIVLISAKTGEGIRDLVAMAKNLHLQASHREGTAALNDTIQTILEERGPSSKLGTRAKVYYVSQVATNPPTVVMVVNDPRLFEGQYERYLLNRLREQVPFSEVPIRLLFRQRQRASLGEMKHRGRAAAGRDIFDETPAE